MLIKVGTALGLAFSMRCIPEPSHLFQGRRRLLPAWLPVASKADVTAERLLEVSIFGDPIVLYRDTNGAPSAMFGVCPHQGARLRKGALNPRTGCVTCPYHGFTFSCNGTGVRLPTKEAIEIPTFRVSTDDDLVYILPHSTGDPIDPPFQPPEAFNSSFHAISGSNRIKKAADVVTENVLDMLHISYVHHFGNREHPLPYQIKYRPLSSSSGRTTFQYRSGQRSISRVVGKADTITVENEFHLPSTTVTRVCAAGNLIKTVVTRALPVDEEETVLYWKIYRNFWCGGPLERWIGDMVMHAAMQQTLREDMAILQEVDTRRRLDGFVTIYDKTIAEFRAAKNRILLQ